MAHMLFGEWDLIIRVKASNEIELRETILNKISKIRGISDTNTLIVADSTREKDKS